MKKYRTLIGAAALTLMLAACGADEEEATSTSAASTEVKTEQVAKERVKEQATTQKVTYLGTEYEVPAQINTVIAASLEAMEDAAMLGVKPAGVISTGGDEIPSYLAKDLAGAVIVGNKKQPSAESMLALNPDVILGTSKWDEAQMQEYNKIATTFPYSHISTNWKDNLVLFGQLVGKEQEAQAQIEQYDKTLKEVQDEISSSDSKDKKVVIIRVRGGLTVYPEAVYLNPSLYEDFGFNVPAELDDITAQSEITYETLAEWNPDMIFLQAANEENAENADIVKEILENPIFKSTTASKENQVYVNIIDPMAQGGTAWSKINFLNAFKENVLK